MSAPELTPQQRAILDAEGLSVAVSAGAGCGKTFVLTRRFLAFLTPRPDRPDPLARIVAITFTEKAAREMRHRVREACAAELRACGTDQVPHWLGILRGLDTARISTIHAYCAQLLRSYSVEAGLDPAFGLLESAFGNTLAARAVRSAVGRALEQGEPDATELVRRFGYERALVLTEALVEGLRAADGRRFDALDAASLADHWRTAWNGVVLPARLAELRDDRTFRRVVQLAREVEPTGEKLAARRANLLPHLAALSRAESTVGESLRSLAGVKEHATFAAVGRSKWGDDDTHAQLKDDFTTLRKIADELLEQNAAFDGDLEPAAALSLAAYRTAVTSAAAFDSLKTERAAVDFDDLLLRSRNLLRDLPTVRRRAADGIDLLMVDEFQDTDPVQADLVRLLCGERLTDGKLFLVGDAKQSIYRFRKADPRVFATLRNELPPASRLPLSVNFRSTPEVLRFVNHTFATEIADYEPLQPSLPQRSGEPAVEFLFPTAEDKENADARRNREARWVARRLMQLFADPTPRIGDGAGNLRRVRPGDICLLVRSWSATVPFERALTDHGLDYYLAGGKAFFAQQEIHDLAHLCRWLEDPADGLSLAGVLRSPMFGLTDDSLMLLTAGPGSSEFRPLPTGLNDPPRMATETQDEQVRFAREVLHELRAKKDRLPLAALLTLAVERTGYDAALLCEHLGPRKLANLRKLISLARGFDAAGGYTMTEFVAALRDAVQGGAAEQLAATHPEAGDVIRIMTVHQAKGLEFPVVLLVDCDSGGGGRGSGDTFHPQYGPIFSMPDEGDGRPDHPGKLLSQWEERRADEAELTRLFYVAATRAKDLLILSACLPEHRRPASVWLRLLSRRFDLETGLPPRDALFGSSGGAAVPPGQLPAVRVHQVEPTAEVPEQERADRGPLRRFRELVQDATPEPPPPLLRRLSPDVGRRFEFTVSELCATDRAVAGVVASAPVSRTRRAAATAEPAADGSLPFLEITPAGEAGGEARVVGTVAHAALERIDFGRPMTADAVADLVERCLLLVRGEADAELHRRVARKVTALLDSPLRDRLAAAVRLHREVEFRLRWDRPGAGPPADIVGTIDGLYQTADGQWHLIDYKAVERGGDADDPVACYALQLAAYGLAVERQFGRRPATATLVRLGPPASLHPMATDAAAFADAAGRIDAAIRSLRGADAAR